MAHLFNETTESEIRARFIKKFDDLIKYDKARSYREICLKIEITAQDFNQIKSGLAMPSYKMLYNLQVTYKIPIEEIFFIQPPRVNLVLIKAQLNAILDKVEAIEAELTV